MPRVTADALCEAMGGHWVQGDATTRIKGIITRCFYTRPGLIYFDVRGGKGGNLNILKAIENGAIGVVLSKHKKVLPFKDKNILVISVPKVWEAFWLAVKFYRDLFDIPVVGVTGTSGKTTTKEMISSIFRRRWKTLRTVGNLNLPDFVPNHIMRLGRGYESAVFEIGMNRPGHISKQAKVIQPQVGVITHIGSGHVEHLGTLENVILEKAGIIQGIPQGGYLVLNADDPNTAKIDISHFAGQVIYYGLDNKADLMAKNIIFGERRTKFTVNIDGRDYNFSLPTFGRHNVYNALAAIAVARIYEFDVKTINRGLARYWKPKMRLQLVQGIRNSVLINDTYNANPDSVMAGLEVLAQFKNKNCVAVLGNMLEQGPYAAENHRKVGEKAAQLGIDWIITVGSLAKEIAAGANKKPGKMMVKSFRLKKQALDFLKSNLPANSVVLVKGSRGAYMERIVRGLVEPPSQSESGCEAGETDSASVTSLCR